MSSISLKSILSKRLAQKQRLLEMLEDVDTEIIELRNCITQKKSSISTSSGHGGHLSTTPVVTSDRRGRSEVVEENKKTCGKSKARKPSCRHGQACLNGLTCKFRHTNEEKAFFQSNAV